MILDTNALSALADGDVGLGSILREATAVALPVIVLGEYQFGIKQSRHRNEYEGWLAGAISAFRILDVDTNTAVYYAEIGNELKRKGRPIPSNDLWIAALARQHAMPLASRDRHFDSISKLSRLDW